MTNMPPPEGALLEELDVYRHLIHGVAPRADVWRRAVGVVGTSPVSNGATLLERVNHWDAQLLARLRARQQELLFVPPTLPEPLQHVVAIERQLPALLTLQRKVWSEVLAHTDAADLCSEAAESLSMRRMRRQRGQRELREVERLDRKRTLDAEVRRKQRRDGFLSQLLAHGEEFKAFHREGRRAGTKLGKAVLSDFESKAKRENKERERAQRERLKARHLPAPATPFAWLCRLLSSHRWPAARRPRRRYVTTTSTSTSSSSTTPRMSVSRRLSSRRTTTSGS